MEHQEVLSYGMEKLKSAGYKLKGKNTGIKKLNDSFVYIHFRKHTHADMFFIDYGVFYLFDQYKDVDFKTLPKINEYHIDGEEARIFGFPFFEYHMSKEEFLKYLDNIFMFLDEISRFSFLQDGSRFKEYLTNWKIDVILESRYKELINYIEEQSEN